MKQFNIFQNPSGKVEVVKIGWSWLAFFLLEFWEFPSMLWTQTLTLISIFLVFRIAFGPVVTHFTNIVTYFLVLIIYPLQFGFYGNNWRENRLISEGYKLKDTIYADNKDQAVELFLALQKKTKL